MDLDTTRGKHAFADIIRAVENGEVDILVGTQMVTKGLDFDKVGLVGIMSADNLLSYPDFRANERAFQVIEQVAGRTGRRGFKLRLSQLIRPSQTDTTVAEALALIRRREVEPVLAAQVFVTMPPYETPAGRYLGVVHFQKLLRYPPSERLGTLLDSEQEPIDAHTPIGQIHRDLATYDLVALPVIDAERHLIGAVTVDDVLDHLLPDDWRSESFLS